MISRKVIIIGEHLLIESMLRDKMFPLTTELPTNFQEEFQKIIENEKCKPVLETMKPEFTSTGHTSYSMSVKEKRNKYLERPLRNFKK